MGGAGEALSAKRASPPQNPFRPSASLLARPTAIMLSHQSILKLTADDLHDPSFQWVVRERKFVVTSH